MESDSVQEMHAKLAAYRQQRDQVAAILVSDPENAQFRQLSGDLDTVIGLTEELVRTREGGVSGGAGGSGAGPESASSNGSSSSSSRAVSSSEVYAGSSSASTTTTTAAAAGGVSGTAATAPSAPAPASASAPFSVGQRVEAVSGDRPYAGTVTALAPDTEECTVKYFEFDTPVVLPFKDLARLPRGALTPDRLHAGYVGQVKYAADGRWYDATVGGPTPDGYGYSVTYAAYGNSQAVPIEYIRAPLLRKEKAKDENAIIAIPENLRFNPTDTEEVQ
jgi:hypothetical protein